MTAEWKNIIDDPALISASYRAFTPEDRGKIEQKFQIINSLTQEFQSSYYQIYKFPQLECKRSKDITGGSNGSDAGKSQGKGNTSLGMT